MSNGGFIHFVVRFVCNSIHPASDKRIKKKNILKKQHNMYRRNPIVLLKTVFLVLLHSVSNVTGETAIGGLRQNVTVSVHSHKNGKTRRNRIRTTFWVLSTTVKLHVPIGFFLGCVVFFNFFI